MAVLKCKMCGGDLNLIEGASTAECEYCGSVQTIPKVDDEKKLTLFARANRLRIACEFDKAAGIYESIVADFPEEAESYWGLVLCKYGIEYVDDPATGKKIPTCHRSSFDSIMEDGDFEQALENADSMARRVYRDEAKQIEEIRKGIIAVSSNEQPYDIFICYKETAENGDRTLDSVLAQDVYDALTDKGYRVFFSRITLEDKLGVEYEPYIFAALNSAKIMLAFGTDYEYFNAVWVKNEWSRFLKLMAKDKSKHLIPCFKGIDAYDMPKEFARLQAQDLGKVGAVQDLLRGIEKLLPRQGSAPVAEQKGSTTGAMVMRGQFALDDGDWAKADEFFERALDENPEDSKAYVGKVLVSLRLSTLEQINDNFIKLDDNKDFERAIRFATGADKAQLENIKENAQKKWLIKCFTAGLRKIYRAKKAEEDRLAREEAQRRREEEARILANDKMYALCRKVIDGEVPETGENLQAAINGFKSISGWKDADSLCMVCQEKLKICQEETRKRAEADRIARKKREEEERIAHQKHLEELHLIQQKSQMAQKLISAGAFHTVAAKIDGTVMATPCISSNSGQSSVYSWKDITAVSAAYGHTVGLKTDGTVVATKYTKESGINWGMCNVDEWRNIVAISAGEAHTVGLKADGTVVATGFRDFRCRVEGWQKIAAVSAGHEHTVGLKTDGTVVATGDNKHGQCEVKQWRNIVAISAGSRHTVGLKADGTVVAVGEKASGRCDVSRWRDIVAISAGPLHTVGLKMDGTVVATGSNLLEQCNVSGWQNIVAVSAGSSHTVGLKKDGTIVSAGAAKDGQRSVSKWKLFENFENLEAEQDAIRIAREKKAEEARIARERRAAGKCQHCGGDLKGFLSKKCVSCGKSKDY